MNKIILVTMHVLCFCGLAHADIVTLTPIADSTVDALNPTAVMNTGNLFAKMVGEVDMPATELTFFYAQFQLPDGLTGQDIGSVNSIDLKISRGAGAATLSLEYYVYGVFDGIDSESADTYSWDDGIGYLPENTLVKFLNPDNEEIFYYSDPAESGFVGFISVTPEGNPNKQFGFFPTQAGFANENRTNMVLDDTDGRLTFYVKVRPNFGVTPLQYFASIEDGTLVPPTLIIDYNLGPDTIPGDYNGDSVVNAADYTVWRDTHGSNTDLTANGDDTGTSMGVIDDADYAVWRANFGLPGAASGSAAVVPEPASIVLQLLAVVCSAGLVRRQITE